MGGSSRKAVKGGIHQKDAHISPSQQRFQDLMNGIPEGRVQAGQRALPQEPWNPL